MKTNKIILLTVSQILLIYSCSLFSQEGKKVHDNLGIEFGLGYNNLTSKYINIGQPSFKINYTVHANTFWLKTSAKIYYSLTIHNFSESKRIKNLVFVGYSNFGGTQKVFSAIPENLIYKSIITFNSVESGINPCFEKNNFQIGIMLKGQYIFSVKKKDFYRGNTKTRIENDISMDYKNFGMATGIKLKYKIVKGLFIAGEAWFGITNLYAHSTYGDEGKLKVYENNYRLLLGYDF